MHLGAVTTVTDPISTPPLPAAKTQNASKSADELSFTKPRNHANMSLTECECLAAGPQCQLSTQPDIASLARPQPVDVKLNDQKAELLGILMEKSVRHGTFTLSSGKISDLYVDAKLTTSDPRAALLVGTIAWNIIKQTSQELGTAVDSVGGLTMGADWMALSIGIAAHLDGAEVKTFSVRKDAKEHGLHKLIEGNFAAGESVVVVEDVITTGGSTIKAINAIEAAGGHVAFVVVLVDRQEGGGDAIKDRGHTVAPIFTRADLDASRRSHIAAA